MLRITTLSLITALSVGLVSTAQAAVVFEASDSNTTTFANTVTGAAGAASGDTTGAGTLDVAISGNNFAAAGIASTSDINTLNGSALTDSDVVTVQFTVVGVTGAGELRSRGLQFGVSASTGFDGTAPDQLIISIGGGENSADVGLLLPSTAEPFSGGGFEVSRPSAVDGFGLTITADTNGWLAEFSDVLAEDTVNDTVTDMSGTFAAGEFLAIFGGGHLYASTQQRNGGVTVEFSEASIDVSAVPEPGSLALLGLGGLLIARRRRG